MKIYSKKDKIIIELNKWQDKYDAINEKCGKDINLFGVIAGDEQGICQAISLGYKDDVQVGDFLVKTYYEREEFVDLCDKLGLSFFEYEICGYCNKVIYGAHTFGDKGNMCMDCEDKEHEKVKENDLLKREYEKGKQDENTAWLQRKRCSTCGEKMKPKPTTDTCDKCFEEA